MFAISEYRFCNKANVLQNLYLNSYVGIPYKGNELPTYIILHYEGRTLLEVFNKKFVYYLFRVFISLYEFVVMFFLDVDYGHLFTSWVLEGKWRSETIRCSTRLSYPGTVEPGGGIEPPANGLQGEVTLTYATSDLGWGDVVYKVC